VDKRAKVDKLLDNCDVLALNIQALPIYCAKCVLWVESQQ